MCNLPWDILENNLRVNWNSSLFFMAKPIAKESIYIFVNLAVIFFPIIQSGYLAGTHWVSWEKKKSKTIARFKAISSPCGWVLWELGPHSAPPHRALNPIKTSQAYLTQKNTWFVVWTFLCSKNRVEISWFTN
jgi:hypothetical protein